MSFRTGRITLQTAVASFVSTQTPRPILQPDVDNGGRVPRTFFGDQDSIDYDAVSVNFFENVMPVAEGWQSVNFSNIFPSPGVAGNPQYLDSQEFYFSDPLNVKNNTLTTWNRALLTDKEVGYNTSVVVTPDNGDGTMQIKLFDHLPLSYTSDVWTQVNYQQANDAAPVTSYAMKKNAAISWAYAAGVQFFCVPGSGIFYYGSAVSTTAGQKTLRAIKQFNTGTVVSGNQTSYQFVKNLPFNDVDVTAICAAQGYLVVASRNKIAYAILSNNTFDFSDFANGAATGSGTRIPEELRGEVTALRAVPGGFIVFSEYNAVSAFYSASNFASPWTFRQLSGCGGVRNVRNLSGETASGAIFGTTSVGLQMITLSNAKEVSAAFNDYLSGKVYELFNYNTLVPEQFAVTGNIYSRCALVGSRYVCVSVGVNFSYLFDIVYVYDLELKRWGKIRKLHTDVLQLYDVEVNKTLKLSDLIGKTLADFPGLTLADFVYQANAAITESRQKIGLLLPTGEVTQVLLGPGDQSDGVTVGVVRLNGIKPVRARGMALHTVEIDAVSQEVSPQVLLNPSYDGRTYVDAYGSSFFSKITHTGDLLRYGCNATMHTAALTVIGKMDLATIIVQFSNEGAVQ